MVVEARADVALAAEYAFALYINLTLHAWNYIESKIRDFALTMRKCSRRLRVGPLDVDRPDNGQRAVGQAALR